MYSTEEWEDELTLLDIIWEDWKEIKAWVNV